MHFVSVVIPTYNRPILLRETLRSVAAQTYPSFEIVVVDDGSITPGVKDVCRAVPQCRYLHQDNAGRSAARNFGAKQARGDLLAFVDDDDLWKPEKLERQVSLLDKNSQVGLVHCPVEEITADGTPTGRIIGINNLEWRSGSVFQHAVRACVVKSPTPLVRREVFEQAGAFNTTLRGDEDWECWARIAYITQFGHLTTPLAYYRAHAGSTTRSSDYLGTPMRMAQTLRTFVEPKDRGIVRRQCSHAYLQAIGTYTASRSLDRFQHLRKAFSLWPPCIIVKQFWGLLIF